MLASTSRRVQVHGCPAATLYLVSSSIPHDASVPEVVTIDPRGSMVEGIFVHEHRLKMCKNSFAFTTPLSWNETELGIRRMHGVGPLRVTWGCGCDRGACYWRAARSCQTSEAFLITLFPTATNTCVITVSAAAWA